MRRKLEPHEKILTKESGGDLGEMISKLSGTKFNCCMPACENDEEKVQHLIDKGIIPKDRKDEQKQLMSSMRLSRNFLSHRIDLFSDSGNVLMLLGGAVTLSRILLFLKIV